MKTRYYFHARYDEGGNMYYEKINLKWAQPCPFRRTCGKYPNGYCTTHNPEDVKKIMSIECLGFDFPKDCPLPVEDVRE